MDKITLFGTVLVIVSVAGCSSSGTSVVDPQAATKGLTKIKNVAEFTDSIRSALINQYSDGNNYYSLESADTATTAVNSPSVSAESNDGNATAVGATESNVTGTNIQEIGVDESDRVKSDGKFLYILNSVSGGDDDPAVIQEAVDGLTAPYDPNIQNQIRILSLDEDAADATLVKELNLELQNEYADGLYHHKGDGFNTLIMTGSSMNGYWGYWESSDAFGGQRSTIRKIDVMDPVNASVTDTLTFGGQIVSSRRVGNYLYVVSRFYPNIEGIDYGSDRDTITNIISNTPLSELMPTVAKNRDESGSAIVDPGNCFVAEKPESSYYSPDIISLFIVDLGSMSVTDGACYLGASETLYASTNAVYLATTQYNYGNPMLEVEPITPDGDSPVVLTPDEFTTKTDIHQFDFDGGSLNYRGSGTVDGHLGWNPLQKPFRLSEKDGYLRVASFSDSNNASVSPVLVTILQPDSASNLNVVGRLPNTAKPAHIGKPGEQLHASRFLGDTAYLVTFRQTDPLYVVDLSTPSDPYIAGELQIDGYSDYLQPIGDGYLLGIGKGAIPSSADSPDEGGRGAFATGVKVSLFDVTDPESPREVNAIEIGKRGTHSGALTDHHGITVQRGAAGQPSRLAFGIDVSDIPQADTDQPWAWYGWRETGLYTFEIKTDANAGISQHGKLIVEGRSNSQTWGPSRYGDRSVIVNDAVFYIHGEQVYGANWNSLGNFSGPR